MMANHIRRRMVLYLAAPLAIAVFLLAIGRGSLHGNPGRAPTLQTRLAKSPKVILWAWEQKADLESIDPRQVGVAFLAQTLYLAGDEVVTRPRMQPLKVSPETFLMATVRIETNQTRRRLQAPTLSPAQREGAAKVIAALGSLPGVQAVQIDFDATASERDFYRALIAEVRRALPEQTALSITALASWCSGDQWLGGLPIDEAVPMLFRMGPDRREILRTLREAGGFSAPACNGSLGISTDEPLAKLPRDRRVYIFRPGFWSKDNVRAALEVLPR